MASSQPNAAPDSKLAEFERSAISALSRLRAHIERNQVGSSDATGYAPMSEVLSRLNVNHWIDHGGMGEAEFDSFLERYLDYSVRLHHPHYIGHQVSVPDYPAALGGIINAVTNNPMAIFEMGPAAATLEFAVINWMLRKVGWKEQPRPAQSSGTVAISDSLHESHAAGVLTHGGSLANLTALLAARARIAPEAWTSGTPHNLAVLVAPSAHYSVARAVSILGLGSDSLVHLQVDDNGVILPEHIASSVNEVRASGRRVMALVANACATATGLYDPLRAIGEFCQELGLWLHADAAHGATALLGEKSRHLLDGIELADSVVWDAHKMMQVPVLAAAVLLKDSKDFDRAFHQDASYLAFADGEDAYHSLPRAIECTKAAIGLKIFLNLAWRGEKALGDFVDDRYAATKEFHNQIAATPGFECPYEPQSNILCFRYGNSDNQQDRLREALLRNRKFHLTAVTLQGKRYLRMTVMNQLTSRKTIESLLNAVKSIDIKTQA